MSNLEIEYVTEAIKNNYVSGFAPPVKRFEKEFAEKFGMKHAIAVNSGGSALFIVLKALGVKEGDEVIMPSFTMVASPAAASHCGAIPVFVDSSEQSFNMDPKKIEEKITPRTKAIMPVHIYGEPCDMDPIMEIAKKHNLHVVEDAAEIHGAKYKGKMAGTFGIAGCFSLFANKIISSGEGGVILTNDDSLANALNHMKSYDFNDDMHFWHKTVAFNLRYPALNAALGSAQLKRFDELVGKRRTNAQYYINGLKDVPGLTLFPEKPDTFSVFWMFGLLAPKRDELMDFLAENGIETRTFFIPMHRQPVYQHLQKDERFPWADHYGDNGLYLPSSSQLTSEQKDEVVGKIKEFYQKA